MGHTSGKFEVINLLLQPYTLEILHYVENDPKRFSDIASIMKNKKTLSVKIKKLLEHGLIEAIPAEINGKYVNAYIISERGKEVIKRLEQVER